MVNSNLPRRVFLKSLGIMLLASGCASEPLALVSRSTATPLPTPSPTPLPKADSVAQAYLSAWTDGDYGAMYALLTPDSQQRISPDQFQYRYRQALLEATVQEVEAQLRALLHNERQAAATFRSVWHTARFGEIETDIQMNLFFDAGRWGVVWQPTLILPQLGEEVTLAFLSEQPTRGNIYDKHFHALASQGQMVTVGVVPQFIQDEPKTIEILAQITAVSPEKIKDSIDRAKPDWFVPIADITFDASLAYDNLFSHLTGVDRRATTVRTYADGDTAAHIIGYMGRIPAEYAEQYRLQGYSGDELVGLTGVEAWAENELAGRRGGRLVTVSAAPNRRVLSELTTVESRAGSSVYLTLDTNFQMQVERLLANRKGAVVVMNPSDGAIYAMASYPRFNPAVFTSGFDAETWTNLYTNKDYPLLSRATQSIYPPGSIFKTVSLAAALESLDLDPDTMFTCTGRWDGLGSAFVKDCWLPQGHGRISLLDGLTQSCNVVFYEVGLALHRSDPNLLPEWARAFGLGAPTGIVGLQEESRGVVPDSGWKQATYNQPLYDGDAVNAAIGQGYMLATPLQIVRLIAALGNGGQLVRPRLVDRIVTVNGQETTMAPEITGKLPLQPESLSLIKGSLEAITSGALGTARQAFAGATYTVAGKTGTAESGQEQPHAWFAGYAPADEPRVAIAVLLEEAGEGGKIAAPLFRQVVEAFFEWEA